MITGIQFYKDSRLIVQRPCQFSCRKCGVNQQVQPYFSGQLVNLLHFPEIHRKSNRDIIPAVACKIFSHRNGGNRDLVNACFPEYFTNFCQLVRFEMGTENYLIPLCFFKHPADVAFNFGFIDKKGGFFDH